MNSGVDSQQLNNGSQGPRAQIDRKLYKTHMQGALHGYPNLDIHAGSVFDLVLDHTNLSNNRWARISGVKLGMTAPLSPTMQC